MIILPNLTRIIVTEDDERFLQQFESCVLDPATFDHKAHLRVAWLYLHSGDLLSACEKTCRGIRRFAESNGAHDKFHRTITEFLVRAMDARIGDNNDDDFEQFLQRNPDLASDALGLIQRSYSRERLGSPKARAAWLAPDLTAVAA